MAQWSCNDSHWDCHFRITMTSTSGNGVGLTTTLTSGIQDISALLPLLGTEQCENHVGSALSGGYLYAATSPMSVFGSLGIAQAGVKTLLASISLPSWNFLGAQKLNDAGFKPSGKNLALIMINPDNPGRHLAETRLDILLKNSQIDIRRAEDLRRISFVSRLTYMIYLNVAHGGTQLDIFSRWAFPIARTFGSFLIATSIQFLIQHRLLTIVKMRAIFHAINNGEHSKSLQDILPIWSPQNSSELCVSSLEQHLHPKIAKHSITPFLVPSLLRGFFRLRYSKPPVPSANNTWLGSVDTTSCPGGQAGSTTIEITQDMEVGGRDPEHLQAKKLLAEELNLAKGCIFMGLQPWAISVMIRLLVVVGVAGTIAGYVGSFSVVQGTNRSNSLGPVIWLLLEGFLSMFRIVVWGWNPGLDDSDPIKIILELDVDAPLSTCNDLSGELLVSKRLPLVRASDFLKVTKSYTGFLEPFDGTDVVVFYTLTRESDTLPNIYQRVLFITIYDRQERSTIVYFEDRNGCAQSITAGMPTISLDTDLGDLVEHSKVPLFRNSPERLSSLKKHYRSILRQLRRDGSAHINEISVDWTLSGLPKARNIPRFASEFTKHHPENDDIHCWTQLGLQKERRIRISTQHLWLEAYMSEVGNIIQSQFDDWYASRVSLEWTQGILARGCALMLEFFSMEFLLLQEIYIWEVRLWSYHHELFLKLAESSRRSDLEQAHLRKSMENWSANARKQLLEDKTTTTHRLARVSATLVGLPDWDHRKGLWIQLSNQVELAWVRLLAYSVNDDPVAMTYQGNSLTDLTRVEYLGFGIPAGMEERMLGWGPLWNYWKSERERRVRGEACDAEQTVTSALANADATKALALLRIPTWNRVPLMVISPIKWRTVKASDLEENGIDSIIRSLQRNIHISLLQFSHFSDYGDLAKAVSRIVAKIPRSITTLAILHSRELELYTPTVVEATAVFKELVSHHPSLREISEFSEISGFLRSHMQPPTELLPTNGESELANQKWLSFTFQKMFVDDVGAQSILTNIRGHNDARIEVRFWVPRQTNDGAVTLALYHRSPDDTVSPISGVPITLRLMVYVNNEHLQSISLRRGEPSREWIPLTPHTHLSPGAVNLVTVTISGERDYELFSINLLDQNNIPFMHEPPEESVEMQVGQHDSTRFDTVLASDGTVSSNYPGIDANMEQGHLAESKAKGYSPNMPSIFTITSSNHEGLPVSDEEQIRVTENNAAEHSEAPPPSPAPHPSETGNIESNNMLGLHTSES